MFDELVAIHNNLLKYMDEKRITFKSLSNHLKILQNQLDHYSYVKNANPSQNFVTKFCNAQELVLEKINKRIELEMKTFLRVKNEYFELFDDLKSKIDNFIEDKIVLAENIQVSSEISGPETNNESETIESKRNSKPRQSTKSRTSLKKENSTQVSQEKIVCNHITSDGLYLIIESLKEYLVIENINICKLLTITTYETVEKFSLNELDTNDNKFEVIDQLIKCILDKR